jgi:hypothetical protein
VLDGAGSLGRVVGAVGSILWAVMVNALVRAWLRLVPHEQKRKNLLTLTGPIGAGKLHRSSTGRTRWPKTAEGLRHGDQGHARGKVVITVA